MSAFLEPQVFLPHSHAKHALLCSSFAFSCRAFIASLFGSCASLIGGNQPSISPHFPYFISFQFCLYLRLFSPSNILFFTKFLSWLIFLGGPGSSLSVAEILVVILFPFLFHCSIKFVLCNYTLLMLFLMYSFPSFILLLFISASFVIQYYYYCQFLSYSFQLSFFLYAL